MNAPMRLQSDLGLPQSHDLFIQIIELGDIAGQCKKILYRRPVFPWPAGGVGKPLTDAIGGYEYILSQGVFHLHIDRVSPLSASTRRPITSRCAPGRCRRPSPL